MDKDSYKEDVEYAKMRTRINTLTKERDAQRTEIWELKRKNDTLEKEVSVVRDLLVNVNKLLELKVQGK